MKPRMILALALAAAMLIAGCARKGTADPASGTPAANPPAPQAPAPQAPAAPDPVPRPLEQIVRQTYTAGTPEAAAQALYDWYLGYRGNPTAAGAYRNNPYIHPEWIATVDAKVQEWKASGAPGFDPFLCAQNKASVAVVGPADVAGSRAALMAYLGPWGDPQKPTWTQVEVYLTLTGQQWQVNRLVCRR